MGLFSGGGLFSFGGSKASSKSESSSLDTSYGYQGDTSQSLSTGTSQSVSGGTSTQDLAFRDIFGQLYGNASNAAGRMAAAAPGLSSQAQMLFSGGANFLEGLQGPTPESTYLEGRLGANPLLEQNISGLGEDIGRFFSEQINPAIRGDAVAAGALGGSRQGVAQGLAADAAARQFATGAAQLRTADQAQRDAAAAQLGQNRVASATAGLAGLSPTLQAAQAGFGAELAPYQALAGILGGPTTLTQSQQFAQASSEDVARAISQAFGEDFSYGTSKATSSSKSKSLQVGFGS